MPSPEKFSPAMEVAKLEQKVKFNLGERCMAYPELWGPVEKAEKEEIRNAAIAEITSAMKKNDFNHAAELMEEVRSYFGSTELKERQSEPETFESVTQPETTRVQEVRDLMKESDWEKAKSQLRSNESDPYYFLAQASEMRKFDQARFDKEYKISEDIWAKLVRALKQERSHSASYFFGMAAELKALDEKRFSRDVKIDDEDWKNVAQKMDLGRVDPMRYVWIYSAARAIDKKRVQEMVPIDKKDWQRIQSGVKEWDYDPAREGFLAGSAQSIKPKEFPDIVISKDQWKKIKAELEGTLEDRALTKFFSLANIVKDLKVE